MAVRGKIEAERELGAHFPSFIKAVSAANSHLWRTYASDMHRTSARSRASLLCDWIGDELKKEMTGKPGIAFPDHYKTTSVAIGQNWYLRPHKLDEAGVVAVNATQACLALIDNNLETIPGTPPSATVIYLGYVENISNPLEPRAVLTCPDGPYEEPSWAIQLGTASPPPVELPQETETEGTRVVPKRQDREVSE